MSFYVLMNLWYGGLLRDTSVSLCFLPRIWSPVTDMQPHYLAMCPTDDWQRANMFSYAYICVWLCVWEGCIVILLAQGQDLVSVLTHPHTDFRHSGKYKPWRVVCLRCILVNSEWSPMQYMGLWVFSLPISPVMIVRICVSYYHRQIGSVNQLPFFR